MAAKKGDTKSELREWIDQQYAEDPELKTRVDALLAEMELEQDLIKLREERGLSQTHAAKLLGVTQPAVAKLETARVKNAKLSTLVRYAAALGGRVKVEIIRDRGRRLVGLAGGLRRAASTGQFVSASRKGVTLMGDTTKKGRDSKSGQFIPVKEARQRPNTTTVERVPKPGKRVK